MPDMKRWVLRRRPKGEIQPGDLEFVTEPLRDLRDGEVLVRTLYLSLDPTNRIWMSDQDQYMPPVGIGDTMRGGTIGVVEQSRSDRLAVGDVVNAFAGWATHVIADGARINPIIRLPGVPLTAHMSVLGGTGLTAWYGMVDIGQPKAGETVVVTAAAGAVGSVAGQLAKQRGARVIGIAGGKAKCDWLTGELGFDGAIDYKNEDVGAALDRLCPDGVDVDFENVGGDIMNTVLSRMNNNARMPLCGLIATYNSGDRSGPANFAHVLMNRITIRGFIVIDFMPRAAEAIAELAPMVADGRLKWKVHVDQGLEGALESVQRLFTGDHDGKLIVQVSPEP
jgi:NADPH-dependent curcumin reductase CurA